MISFLNNWFLLNKKNEKNQFSNSLEIGRSVSKTRLQEKQVWNFTMTLGSTNNVIIKEQKNNKELKYHETVLGQHSANLKDLKKNK